MQVSEFRAQKKMLAVQYGLIFAYTESIWGFGVNKCLENPQKLFAVKYARYFCPLDLFNLKRCLIHMLALLKNHFLEMTNVAVLQKINLIEKTDTK